ncbi:GNAT family N-acetyltransferase [Pedobacter sp. P351]|uniref:GNAT family N-acetyltransferase n=1 Tax=Pedobacter superstes TaxID=3133441 RepID=UPI0030AE96BF
MNIESLVSKKDDEITIREGEPEDAAMIAYFSRKTFLESYGSHNKKRNIEKFLQLHFSVNDLVSEVSRRHITILLAYRTGVLLGYGVIREAQNPPEINSVLRGMELSRLYVDSTFKGTGVGNALMKECISEARLKEKEILWLSLWNENEQAIDFYTKWGFKKCGSKIFIFGEETHVDWIMKKDLQF